MAYDLFFRRQTPRNWACSTSISGGVYTGVPVYPYQQAPSYGGDPGLILAWPIIALIEFFQSRSAKAEDRAAAAQAVNEAITKGITSGDKFRNALWLTFGFNLEAGYKYGNRGEGVPEVRASVVKKVRSGDPKAVAFYKAALKAGYTPPKGDPGLAQMAGANQLSRRR